MLIFDISEWIINLFMISVSFAFIVLGLFLSLIIFVSWQNHNDDMGEFKL